MDEKFQLFSIEQTRKVLQKFSVQNIKKYNPTYIYKNKEYELSSSDYIWLLYQSLDKTCINEETIEFPKIISFVFYPFLTNNSQYKIFHGIDEKFGIEKLNVGYVLADDFKKIYFYHNSNELIYENNCISNEKFFSYVNGIINKINFFNLQIFVIDCTITIKKISHACVIYIQIIENDIYLYGYDPQAYCLSNQMNVLKKTLECLGKAISFISKQTLINKKNINNVYIDFSKKKSITCFLDHNLLGYNNGYCVIFSFFFFNIFLNIIFNWSSKIPQIGLIFEHIEEYLLKIYDNDKGKHEFLYILLNFANFFYEIYYISVNNIINESYKKNIIKKKFFQKLDINFKFYFETEILEKISKKNNYNYSNIFKSKEFLKPLGYTCLNNYDCESKFCNNRLCDKSPPLMFPFSYFFPKKYELEELRSVGNPCLNDDQCKSKKCIENICSNDYQEETYDDNENLEQIYKEEWEMLDRENEREYNLH